MGNVIQIKRGSGQPGAGILANGELGYDTTNECLYIGDASGSFIDLTGTKLDIYTEGKVITANSNLGTYTIPGVYRSDANRTKNLQGKPTDLTERSIKLIVITGFDENYRSQLIFVGQDNRLYYRSGRYNSESEAWEWYAWVDLTKVSTSSSSSATLESLGITASASELNVLDGITASTAELNVLDGITTTSSLQTQLNNLSITGAASTIKSNDLTKDRVLVSDSNGKVAVHSAISTAELNCLNGIDSNIQNQLDAKQVNVLNIGTEIPKGSNLNDYKTPGKYYFPSSETSLTDTQKITNSPFTDSGYGIIVMSGYIEARVWQIAFGVNKIRHRYYNGSTWNVWKTITSS